MAQSKSRFFSVMVVGNEPKLLMDEYDINKTVEPYIKYKYLDAHKYRETAIKALEKIVSDGDKISLANNIKKALKERLKALKSMSDFDYYRSLTDGLYYDSNGNALSEENPNGHWVTCRNGGHFSLPLILKDGNTSYSAKSSDVDWEKMHLNNQEIYAAAWELVVEEREPINDNERQILQSMGDKKVYFSNFKSKEDYVMYSTAYWNFAYVDENGWKDADNTCNGDETEWIRSFYQRFIEHLKDDDMITIFECTINED